MKKFAVFILFISFSCKKEPTNKIIDTTIPDATFSFQRKGISYHFDGDLTSTNLKGSKIAKVPIYSYSLGNVNVYYLIGSNGLPATDSNSITISIPISIDTNFTNSTYGGNVFDAFGQIGGNHYGNGTFNGDNFRLTFTAVSNSDKWGAGTFYALLWPADTSNHIIDSISNGEFKFVKIIK